MKNQNNDHKRLIYSLTLIILILLGGGLLVSIEKFYIGNNNADIGSNLKYLNAEFDLNLIDVGTHGVKTGTELYISGMEQVKNSYISSIFFSFFIGYLLCWLLLNSEKD